MSVERVFMRKYLESGMKGEAVKTVVIKMTVEEYCAVNNALINMLEKVYPSDRPVALQQLTDLLASIDI